MGSAERVELPNGAKEIRRRIGNEVVVIHTVDGWITWVPLWLCTTATPFSRST